MFCILNKITKYFQFVCRLVYFGVYVVASVTVFAFAFALAVAAVTAGAGALQAFSEIFFLRQFWVHAEINASIDYVCMHISGKNS